MGSRGRDIEGDVAWAESVVDHNHLRSDTPKHPVGIPLTLWRLDQSSCRRTLLASERVSPSARERVPT